LLRTTKSIILINKVCIAPNVFTSIDELDALIAALKKWLPDRVAIKEMLRKIKYSISIQL
jgi:hypothetical protein